MKSLKDFKKRGAEQNSAQETPAANQPEKKKKGKVKGSITKLMHSRRFKHGSMATVVTAVFVVAVVLVNVIASLLLERFPVSVDLTTDQIFQLTDESVEFVKGIDDDVNIIVCKDEQDLSNSTVSGTEMGKQAVEIINQYAQYNDNIHVEYVDLLEQPEIAQEYSAYSVTDYSVIIETDKRTKVVSVNDFIDAKTNSQTQETVIQSQAEQVMTSALMYVTDDEVAKVSVLTGHTEIGCQGMTSILEDNNFEVTEQNLMTEDIDPEASLAVIYAPTTDYTAEELKKLDAFLDNNGEFGKSIIYIASIQQPELPNLESFLAEWGIQVENSVLMETDNSNVYDRTGTLFGLDYASEDYTKGLRQADLPYLGYRVRPITTTFGESGNRSTTVLLNSHDTSVAVPLTENEGFNIDDATKQSYGVAVMGQRVKYEGTTPKTSYVIAFGGVDMFNNQFISDARYNNNEYTINLINTVTGKENNVNISSVSFDNASLTVNQLQAIVLQALFSYILPVAMIVFGVVVWLRRRHK